MGNDDQRLLKGGARRVASALAPADRRQGLKRVAAVFARVHLAGLRERYLAHRRIGCLFELAVHAEQERVQEVETHGEKRRALGLGILRRAAWANLVFGPVEYAASQQHRGLAP